MISSPQSMTGFLNAIDILLITACTNCAHPPMCLFYNRYRLVNVIIHPIAGRCLFRELDHIALPQDVYDALRSDRGRFIPLHVSLHFVGRHLQCMDR